jgi:hypothetical protein
MTVSTISRINYYELILPTLSETQLKLYEIIKKHPKGITSYDLIQILGKEHHKFSGRLSDLIALDMIKVSGMTEINGSTYGIWKNNLDKNGNPKIRKI